MIRCGRAAARVGLIAMLVAHCAPASVVETVEVLRTDLVRYVDVVGELEATSTTPVRPPVIEQWRFKIAYLAADGQSVEAGDRLIAFDVDELTRRLEAAKREEVDAKTALEEHRSKALIEKQDKLLEFQEGQAELAKIGLKLQATDDQPQVELETLRIDKKIAALKVAHHKSQIAQAQRNEQRARVDLRTRLTSAQRRAERLADAIRRMVITADRAGTVVLAAPNNQNKLKVGDRVWRGSDVLQIVSLDRMRGIGEVAEIDSPHLAVGCPVTFRIDANPEVELTGRVAEIGDTITPKSWPDPGKIVKVDVEDIDSRGLLLRPGMRFRGRIEVERTPNVLRIPVAAVFVHAKEKFVYRRRTGGFDRVVVRLGRRSNRHVEVRAGLAAGDRVALTVPRLP